MGSRAHRAHRAAAGQTDAPAQQIEELAFNTAGHAMHVPVQFHHQVINAYKPNSTPYNKAIEKAKTEDTEPYRESLEFTEKERGEQELGMDRFLVVGFVPRQFNKQVHGKALPGKQGPPVGTQPPVNIMREDLPLLAVVKIAEKETTSLKYWVLLKPKTGLCTPHTVSQIEVFFLKDFRENVGQFKLRGPAWSKLVSDVALSFAQTAEIPSAKQQRYRRAKDITKLVLEPGMSFINELVALTLSFERYRQPWHLQELRSVLEVVQEDIRFQPMPAYWGLRKFADLGEVLTEEDAEKVVEDVQDLWKDVAVTVSAVLKLKEGLVVGQTFLSFRYLRGFIAQGCFALTKAETKGKIPDLVKLTKNTLEHTERIMGPVESTPSIVTDNEGALLAAITAKVTEIKEAGKRFDLGVKQIAGDAGPDATLVDIWGKYADALDTDSAKKAFFEAVRYLASEVRTREEGLYGMVLDLSKVLDEMKLIKDD